MRGQVSVFIATALLLLVIFGFVFYLTGSVEDSVPSSNVEVVAFERYVSSCVFETAKSMLFYYGIEDVQYEGPFLFDFCFDEYSDDVIDVGEGTYSFDRTTTSIVFVVSQPHSGLTTEWDFFVEVPTVSQTRVETNSGFVVRDTIIVSPDDRVKLLIPQNTRITDANGVVVNNPDIKIELVSQANFEQKIGLVDYRFSPEGLQFSRPVQYSHKIDFDSLPTDIDFESFMLEWTSSQGIDMIPATYDFLSETISATITHFSTGGPTVQSSSSAGTSTTGGSNTDCQNIDYDTGSACATGWSNCDCSGGCHTQGFCSASGSTASITNGDACQNVDANTGFACAAGWSNCDCANHCGTRGSCSGYSGVFNPGSAGPTGSSGSPGSTGGFVWKPVSESNGKLVILLPSSYTSRRPSVSILDANGQVLESRSTPSTCSHNGNRCHYRFSKPGAGYGTNLKVVATFSGGTHHWNIPNGARRVG